MKLMCLMSYKIGVGISAGEHLSGSLWHGDTV